MKRKVLATFLTASMAVGMLAGCGGSNSGSTSEGGAAKEEGSADASEEGGEAEADVNEDGTVNNPEAVKVDENKLVFWSLFSGGDGEFMDKIIEEYNSG